MTGIFNFGDIVVVEGNFVGVVVKCWERMNDDTFNYDVYVRSYNSIKNYQEEEIRKLIYDKELTDAQLEYYD